jgi:inhibitor of KinA
MDNEKTYRIIPLGESALTIEFGNSIDEEINDRILAFNKMLGDHHIPGIIETVPAYNTITIYFDLSVVASLKKTTTCFEWMKHVVSTELQKDIILETVSHRHVKIPVCYEPEYGIDIESIANKKKLSTDEVVALHVSKKYRVYMLGFLPGFPYMGKVDKRISMSRKSQPENVLAGSVAIAGFQTGIYPLTSPGGWHVVGRTPLAIFDVSKTESVLLRIGDIIEFYPISKKEFESY